MPKAKLALSGLRSRYLVVGSFGDHELHLTSPSRRGCFASEVNHICRGGRGLLQLQNFFSTIFILEVTGAALLVGHYVDARYYCSFLNALDVAS